MSAEEQAAATPVDTPAEVTETANATEETKPKSESAKPKSASSKKAAAPSSKTAKSRSTAAAPKKSGGGGTSGGDKKFEVGDIVLARLKGYPPWPARIADPDSVPSGVTANRPSKSPTIYCVNYFPAGDFSWLHSREITRLSPSEIDDFLGANHRKAAGGLRVAYETAKDPSDWIAEQTENLRQREDEEKARQEGVDELEDEEAPSGGKRKRAAASDKSGSKKAKAAKKAEEPKSKTKAKPKGAAAPASAAENQAPADDDPSSNDPECIKVKDWRHKLQRAFLGKGLPTAAEMDTYNEVFNTIEAYKGMTIEALQYSKIGKVMKKIATLEGIPRNDELKITDRASKLMNEWHDFIQNSGSNGDAPKSEAKAEEKDDAPAAAGEKDKEAATNGDAAPAEEKMDVEA